MNSSSQPPVDHAILTLFFIHLTWIVIQDRLDGFASTLIGSVNSLVPLELSARKTRAAIPPGARPGRYIIPLPAVWPGLVSIIISESWSSGGAFSYSWRGIVADESDLISTRPVGSNWIVVSSLRLTFSSSASRSRGVPWPGDPLSHFFCLHRPTGSVSPSLASNWTRVHRSSTRVIGRPSISFLLVVDSPVLANLRQSILRLHLNRFFFAASFSHRLLLFQQFIMSCVC